MKVLVKQARITSSASQFNGQIKDILVMDGVITTIADWITDSDAKVISSNELHVSIGWMDIFANFGDPGYEQKETLETGSASAASGGFTDVMIIPNTNPVIGSKSQVEYILSKAANLPVSIYPIASVTKNAEGKELAEMYDMQSSFPGAYSDGIQGIQSPGLLLKALQYILPFNGIIIQMPGDHSIIKNGLVNEGIVSTRLGLPGMPAIAEEMMIARDIELLKYTKSKLHITGVSTKKGIELIANAKREGLHLSCSVTPYHCTFSDDDLVDYDTNFKVDPPLRTNADKLAIQQALADGLVDCMASHHMPQHRDDKTCEFEYAKYGMSGLETLFGVVNNFGIPLEKLINMMTIAPRKIFNIPIPRFEENAPACLTFFDPSLNYVFEKSMIRSKSANNPFVGTKMNGKVIGIFNNNQIILNDK